MIEQLVMLQEKAAAFKPDAVFIADSPNYVRPIVTQILTAVRRHAPIPYPGLEAIVRETGALEYGNLGYPIPFQIFRSVVRMIGVPTRMPGPEADRRLRLAADDLVRWTLGAVAETARANGAVPVFVFLTTVSERTVGNDPVLRDAENAGFIVFNIIDLWRDRDYATLRIAASDNHPNAAGNRLIAGRLTELIRQHRDPLRLEASPIR
jgi:hypothetical protein